MSMGVDRQLASAAQMYSIGQVDGAMLVLRGILTEDPDLAEAHAWLAACLLRKRRIHAAAVEAGMALALNPDSPLTHWVSAELALARREFDVAKTHIDWLLGLVPDVADFHRLKARWMLLSGQRLERLQALERALECDPNDPETLADLAEYHCETGKTDEAMRYALEALQSSAENTSALVAMGRVLLSTGDLEGAREHAIAALQSDPQNPGALHLLTAVKARSSWWQGLWWRYATWGQRVGPTRNILVLMVAFVFYRILVIASLDAGERGIAQAIQFVWLAIVVYTFIGPALFKRALQKELATVQLKHF